MANSGCLCRLDMWKCEEIVCGTNRVPPGSLCEQILMHFSGGRSVGVTEVTSAIAKW